MYETMSSKLTHNEKLILLLPTPPWVLMFLEQRLGHDSISFHDFWNSLRNSESISNDDEYCCFSSLENNGDEELLLVLHLLRCIFEWRLRWKSAISHEPVSLHELYYSQKNFGRCFSNLQTILLHKRIETDHTEFHSFWFSVWFTSRYETLEPPILTNENNTFLEHWINMVLCSGLINTEVCFHHIHLKTIDGLWCNERLQTIKKWIFSSQIAQSHTISQPILTSSTQGKNDANSFWIIEVNHMVNTDQLICNDNVQPETKKILTIQLSLLLWNMS